jgi:GNAT superfamily N-acetyltransferase
MLTAGISLDLEDPRLGDGAILLAELAAALGPLYPEDDEEPAGPWTLNDLVTTFVVARVRGAAAGCGALAPLDSESFEIARMYVRPGFRGQRIADQVLIKLEDLARVRGADVLMLRCGPRQPAALAVYQRNGYWRRGAFAYHREHPTNIFFEKRLST